MGRLTSETDVKVAIRDYLDSLGEKCWHAAYTNHAGYGKKGVPDRLVCYRGRFLAIEVKRDARKTPTPWQQREIAAIIASGGKAIVAWDVEHVKGAIRQIDAEFRCLIECGTCDRVHWSDVVCNG